MRKPTQKKAAMMVHLQFKEYIKAFKIFRNLKCHIKYKENFSIEIIITN